MDWRKGIAAAFGVMAMAGVAAEKILVSNHSEGRIQLVASATSTATPQPNPVPGALPLDLTAPADAQADAAERTQVPSSKARKRASSTAVLDKA